MKRNAEKTGIYDPDNATFLIRRVYKDVTKISGKDLIIKFDDKFSYEIVLGKKETCISRAVFDDYYKNYSNKIMRISCIEKIKEKLKYFQTDDL